MANDIDRSFGRVLEAHRDVPAAMVMTPIANPSFAVLRCLEDAPFFAQVTSVLNSEPQVRPTNHLIHVILSGRL